MDEPGRIYARYLLGSVCVRLWIIVCSYNLKLSVFTKTQPSKRSWSSTYTRRIQKHPQIEHKTFYQIFF